MTKKMLFLLCILFCNRALFSMDIIQKYEQFTHINNVFVDNGCRASQRLFVIEDDKITTEKEAESFFSGDSQLTFFDDFAFLSNTQGYWIMNKKMKMPLKISGNYKVEEIEIQDVLRIDYANDYKIYGQSENELHLERTSKKMTYKYITFTYISDNTYQIHFLDKDKKQIKELLYSARQVDDFYCFATIEIHSHVFTKNRYLKYETNGIELMDIPYSLFTSMQMTNLIDYVKRRS